MRNKYLRINCIFYFLGNLLGILGLILLFPVIAVLIYWGQKGDGWLTVTAFVVPSLASFLLAVLLRKKFKPQGLYVLSDGFGACEYPEVLLTCRDTSAFGPGVQPLHAFGHGH